MSGFTVLAAGTSNITQEIHSSKPFEALPACSNTDTKQLTSVKVVPRTSQNVNVPSDASSHRTGSSFSLDALSKTLLQDRLTDLKDLIRDEDGQAVFQNFQTLIFRISSEIEIWLNRGGAMTFEAQFTLSNMAYNGPTKNNIFNQFSKNEKYLLACYLSLLRSATCNDALSNEKRRMLTDILCECEEFVNEPENAMSDKVHHDELNLLHEICDGDIAFHSVELAIKIIADMQTLLPSELHNESNELRARFEKLGHISDLEKAISMQRRAILSTPLNSPDRPSMLTNLGTSYRCRYDRFGDVKDIDSAIREQFKAAASIPLDSTHRPAILLNLGNVCKLRFGRFGEKKDIDSAVEQYLKAAGCVPLNNGHRPNIICSLGYSFLTRFERFGHIQDLESAIEQLLEAVVSIPLNSAERPAVHTSLGFSYFCRFERFGMMKDIDSAIEQQLKAAACTPLNSEDRPDIFRSLGDSYQCRFEGFGNIQDLESAIKHRHEAVTSFPLDDPDRPGILYNLGVSYQDRFERFGKKKDIDSAIERLLEAVASAPPGSPNRAKILSGLGNIYCNRFKHFGEVNDIDSAIDQQLEAVAQASTLPNSTERATFIYNLVHSYHIRFERFGKKEDINFAIDKHLEAIAAAPPDSPKRAEYLDVLGNAYRDRFTHFGEANDIDSAISQQLEAVASTLPNSAERATFLYKSGRLYLLRFERFVKKKDIDFAIEQQLEAIAAAPPDSPSRAAYLNDLGNTYCDRFRHFGEVNDIDSAINQQLAAVASTLPESGERALYLHNLGLSYMNRFEHSDHVKDIDSAIERLLEAVASAPPGSSNRAEFLNSSGNIYCSRFIRFGEVNDIDSAINQQLDAVASTLPNSADRATYLHNLGLSYVKRFEYSDHVKDIDSAIERILEAVTSIPLDSSKRPGYLSSLGASYGSRFLRLGEVKDIDLAIKQELEAVTSTPLDSTKRAGRLSNLGISYKLRFKRFGEMKDNDFSIKHLLEAVSSIPPNSPDSDSPTYLNYLGSSYADRFGFSGDVKDINLAIEKHLEVVASVPIDCPERSRFLDQLARSHLARFEGFGDVKDLDLAIKQQLETVASASLGTASAQCVTHRPIFINNLGYSYQCRFEQLGEVKDNDLAIEILAKAVATTPLDSPHRATSLCHLGFSYLNRFRINQEPTALEESISNFRLSSLSLNGPPSTRIQGSLQWAHLAHKHDNLESASEAYDQAFRLLPQVAWIGLNAIAQLKELNSDIQTLGCNAAACMIAFAEAEHHNRQRHLGRAIELLDQGRSILWSQTSNFKRDMEDLQGIDSDLASDLDIVGKFLVQGCFRDQRDFLSETDAQLYRRNAEKWEELVHRIRGLPGYHHFLLPSPISTLRTAATEGPVVIINSSQYRCDAVIVPSKGDLVLVPLPEITAAELESLANQQEEFASRKSKSVWIPSKEYSMPSERLEQVLNQTWLLVGEPIVQKFKELGLVPRLDASLKSRVWWCLTGSLSFLPIHASYPPTKPGVASIGMMDIVVSSYTPTISTLLRAQQRSKLKRPTFQMLAVGQSSIAGMMPLPGVTEEIAFIQKILGVETLTLDECKATVDGVAASLPTCSWAHFACHGVQDLDNPMDSGLVMWDGRLLTLSRLAQSSLASAEFAFLSCCESAKGSKQFPNEAMHLAAGLQFIGYRGVIGTMWSVGDKDALSVAIQIYGELFKDGTGVASASKAALALHQAVLFLRANNVPLARWVPFVHFGL